MVLALDTETGLSLYLPRAYDPSTGRFLQPDPLPRTPADPRWRGLNYLGRLAAVNHPLPSAGFLPSGLSTLRPSLQAGYLLNPLGLNAYTYALNNPLRFTDPFGLEKTGRGYWQALLGIGGTAGGNPFLMPAGFISGSINIGVTSEGQLFIQVQGSGLFGLGLFGGVGGQVGVSHSISPIPAGISSSSSFEGQVNAGWGSSSGLTGGIGRGSGSLSISPNQVKGGVGYGIMAAGGVSWTTTAATPSLGEIISAIESAFEGDN